MESGLSFINKRARSTQSRPGRSLFLACSCLLSPVRALVLLREWPFGRFRAKSSSADSAQVLAPSPDNGDKDTRTYLWMANSRVAPGDSSRFGQTNLTANSLTASFYKEKEHSNETRNAASVCPLTRSQKNAALAWLPSGFNCG